MQRTSLVLLSVSGLLFIMIGVASLLDPAGAIAPTGIEIHTIAGHNEVRANYGGMILVLGLYFLAGALRPPLRSQTLLVLALFCTGLVLGRSVSLVVDGNPGLMMNSFLALEVLAAALAMGCWRQSLQRARKD